MGVFFKQKLPVRRSKPGIMPETRRITTSIQKDKDKQKTLNGVVDNGFAKVSHETVFELSYPQRPSGIEEINEFIKECQKLGKNATLFRPFQISYPHR